MGALCAKDELFDKEVSDRNRQIEKSLKQEYERLLQESPIKLLLLGDAFLLLGAGETGKSTVLKQLQLIHGGGLSEADKDKTRQGVVQNIITIAKTMVEAMHNLKIPYGFDPSTVPIPEDELPEPPLPADGATPVAADGTTPTDVPPQDRKVSLAPSQKSRGSIRPYLTAMDIKTIEANELAQGTGLLEKTKKPDDDEDVEVKLPPVKSAAQIAAEELFNAGQIYLETAAPGVAKAVADIKAVLAEGYAEEVNPLLKAGLVVIWQDLGVKYCVTRNGEYQLLDSYPYYMADLDRFCDPKFSPTDQDILACRVMTTGISENKVKIKGRTFIVFDVGGQRSLRKKWVQYFDDASAIIFLVAISSYNQVCFEDGKTNRIIESMTLFSVICNHPAFAKTTMIVFMNKVDLFKEKLAKNVQVGKFFPTFQGVNDYEDTANYFQERFLALNKTPARQIYTYFTCCTDTKMIKNVIEIVIESILVANLASAGLM